MKTALRLDHPASLILLMAVMTAFVHSSWMTLINNFAVEAADFSGREIGTLQSLREIPGFLAFTAILLIRFIPEQRFAYLSLALLLGGVAITGSFPTTLGLYATTVIMSIGFHYFETMNQSLTLQWIGKKEAPAFLGKVTAWQSMASVLAFAAIYLLFELIDSGYRAAYLILGGVPLLGLLYVVKRAPMFPQPTVQTQRIFLKRNYWLYYLLTFMSGARRQIFIVFGGFLLVEKFGVDIENIALLYLVNQLLVIYLAPIIGRFVGRFGERRALVIEYCGLILVFSGYALVDNVWLAMGLYMLDHVFFAMALAIKTYFQKIADPADIAATAAVSFTINHIAAVVLPFALGLLWLQSPSIVFFAGAGMACISLLLALLVPRHPTHEQPAAVFQGFVGRREA